MSKLYTPSAGIFLLVEKIRNRLSYLRRALGALDSPDAPRVVSVVGYYDMRADRALFDLRYDEWFFDDAGRQYVANVALLADVGMIQPDELSAEQRMRFLDAPLARCTWRGSPQLMVVGALSELGRAVGSSHERLQSSPIITSAQRPSRSADDPPMLPVPARGTRDKLEYVGGDQEDPLTANGTYNGDQDAVVQEADEDCSETSPYQAPRAAADRIHARYFSGGRWLAARLGAISRDRATLVTTALPRVDDRVEVALSFGEHRAVVWGSVAKVSTRAEATTSGAAEFALKFTLDDDSKLPALLLAARDAKVTIKPPPRRAFRRLPVERLVALGTAEGVVKGTALDLSAGGMFVRSQVPLSLDSTLTFSLVLDDGNGPIGGSASVVRRISDADANARGLVAGFGLAISDMSEGHRVRWRDFLARVERRVEKRVLIGAPPARFAELRAGLASLGYAVIGGTDPDMLLLLANDNARLADAALIDAGWLRDQPSTASVEELLAYRNVPCVKMQGEVLRVRQAIDRLLDVL